MLQAWTYRNGPGLWSNFILVKARLKIHCTRPAATATRVVNINFYVGEYRALRGERPEALALFRSARDGCPNDFIEFVPAAIEVNSLEKQK
jgi:lipoprotein NlpI